METHADIQMKFFLFDQQQPELLCIQAVKQAQG